MCQNGNKFDDVNTRYEKIKYSYVKDIYFEYFVFHILCECISSSSSCIYIIVIIIIMSRCHHGIPWHSFAICLYHPSLQEGLLDYILCPYRVDVDKIKLVVQHLHVRGKKSIGERRSCVRSYFSSIVLFVLFG